MANARTEELPAPTSAATRPASSLSVYSQYPDRDPLRKPSSVDTQPVRRPFPAQAIHTADREKSTLRQRTLEAPSMPDWYISRPKPTVPIPSASVSRKPRKVMHTSVVGNSALPAQRSGSANTNKERVFTDSRAVREAAFELWLSQKKEEQLRKDPRNSTHSASKHTEHNGNKGVPQTHELFRTSEHVRNAAYEDWLAKKLIVKRQAFLQEQAAEKEKKTSAERAAQERAIGSEQSFAAWKEKKDKAFRERIASKKAEEERKEKEHHQEEEVKKRSSESAFAAWKSVKDEKLATLRSTEVAKRKEQKQQERHEATAKQESAESAFKCWKSRKDELLKEKLHEKTQAEVARRKVSLEEEACHEDKRQRAVQVWMKQKQDAEKEKQVRSTPSPIEASMVWSPPGTIRHPASPKIPMPIRTPSPTARKSSLSYHPQQLELSGHDISRKTVISSPPCLDDKSIMLTDEIEGHTTTQTKNLDNLHMQSS